MRSVVVGVDDRSSTTRDRGTPHGQDVDAAHDLPAVGPAARGRRRPNPCAPSLFWTAAVEINRIRR